jgi:hypothetical protein
MQRPTGQCPIPNEDRFGNRDSARCCGFPASYFLRSLASHAADKVRIYYSERLILWMKTGQWGTRFAEPCANVIAIAGCTSDCPP